MFRITYARDDTNRWLSAHQMTVNGQIKNITESDILTAGANMGIPSRKCRRILSEVSAVAKRWMHIAADTEIREDTAELIRKDISLD